MRASEQDLRLTIDTIPGFVAVWSAAGELETVNQRILDYLGVTLEELKGGLVVVHEDDLPHSIKAWKDSVATGKPFEIDHRVRRADGVYRWWHTRGMPLRDAQHQIERWYKLATDIDDRRRAEEALRASQAELAHVTRVMSMGELTASIAHELNSPLAAVVTSGHACLRWLDRETPNLEEVRGAVERMIQDGIRGGAVIARIRALMKREPPARQRLDINEVVRETVAIAPIPREGSTVRIELARDLAHIVADRVALQQVLLNLIGNAVDAMKPIKDRSRELSISTAIHGPDAVSVAVADTGVGVEAHQLSRLFEPFHTSKPEGLGMGLSISRSIVESHGGRLWAEPNHGDGMTFRFTLPIENAGAA